MNQDFFDNIGNILMELFNSKTEFYKDKYKNAGISYEGIKQFDEDIFKLLPVTAKKELALVPYKTRLYLEGPGVNKLVYFEPENRYFMIHRLLEEISKDSLRISGDRPMVIINDMYDAIERCLFFYEKNILPLIGEVHNSAVIYSTANQYEVDSIYIDSHSVKEFRDGLIQSCPSLKNVTVIDSKFDYDDFKWSKNIKSAFILSISEFGSIAYNCPDVNLENEIILHPVEGVFIEPSSSSIITSSRLTACPMIRYESGLKLQEIKTNCNCSKQSLVF